MQKIINFFRGSVLYTVTGAFPERFLNLCAQNAVAFWGLEWLDDHTLRLCFARKDAKKARTLAEKVMCQAKAARRAGVPFFLAKFRRRYAFLAGLALAVAAVCVLSRFILTIEVTGNRAVSTAVILSELNRQGVRVGAYGPSIDEKVVSQEALLRIPALSWMAVNLHGTRAEVIVREKVPKPDIVDRTVPSHVVSAATGIITHMEVLEGQPLFQEGDTVLAGEILISGVIDVPEPQYADTDLGTRITHAMGNVWARTWRTLEAQIPLEAQVKRYTGEEVTRYSLGILDRRLNFYGNSGISLDKYDKITSSHSLTLPGGRVMPLVLRAERYRGYATEPVALDAEAARTLLEERLLERLDGLVGEDGEVLRTDFTVREENGILVVTLLAECREQIGRVVEFEGQVGHILPGAGT
ncbi:sporulation protein YqfD [Intestinimonas massiliensis]|uniref:Sporulation protein YqfD n=1 Tax=Intestinimonas massiliensis (ex Afouda et al. 2020) TaxID=1673721 RepID=A0AAW5JMN5_9FIRM|nr:sporulation protein YqfD [Intestinimonas massiliensis (ex Afouda et al. 2020)]MCQ4771108.1 sporulation protein YqfD [Intestinimonas massiliensis (ex Afouda et al. 2020)]